MTTSPRRLVVDYAKRLVRSSLDRVGLTLIRSEAASTMEAGLRRAAASRRVETVIDVGASTGCWSEQAMRHYPAARYLLVEAQAHHGHEEGLKAFQARHPGQVEYVIAAAGPRDGTVGFHASAGEFGGSVSEDRANTQIPMVSLDAELKRKGLVGPYLLKLDTHGFEVPILEGATETLKGASLLVIEAYNFTLQPGCLRFPELCAYLEARGFRCLDLVEPLHRPKDGALWQVDLFFVPSSSPEFASNVYEAV